MDRAAPGSELGESGVNPHLVTKGSADPQFLSTCGLILLQ